MMHRLSRWQPRHLLAAWFAYWVLLLVGIILPALPHIWRATRPDGKGSISVNFNGSFQLSVTEGATQAWTGSIGGMTLLLLAAIPPLIIWGFWLRAQKQRLSDPALLGESDSDFITAEREAMRERRDLR